MPQCRSDGLPKRRYTKAGAKWARRQMMAHGATGIDIYRCRQCGTWHLGHKPQLRESSQMGTATKEKVMAPRRPAADVAADAELANPYVSMELIAVDAFTADPDYQRELNDERVNHMAENYNEKILGFMVASRREDSELLYIIDGQHRIGMMRRLEKKKHLMQTLVFNGLTKPEEAQMFVLMNRDRVGLTQSDIFYAEIAEGQPAAIDIRDTLAQLGLKLHSTAQSATMINCVQAVRRVYNAGGASLLDATLSMSLMAWGNDPPIERAFHEAVVEAIARTLYFNENRIDLDRYRAVLAEREPKQHLAHVKGIQSFSGGQTVRLLTGVLLENYNKGLPRPRQLDIEKMFGLRNDPFKRAARFRRKTKAA